jgi:hypothetical protein
MSTKTRIDSQRSANDNARPPAKTRMRHARRSPPQHPPRRRSLMRDWAPAILATFFTIGCGADFDSASLVVSTRVIGAQVEAPGADNRASVAPGETASVTWLVTAPGGAAGVPATLSWAFALCTPAPDGALGCATEPLATFQGTGTPTMPIAVPAASALGAGDHLTLYGRVCNSGAPMFDANGLPACSTGAGTTASVAIHVQGDVNHNPTADRGASFDGAPWVATPAGGDPCATGPRVPADGGEHFVGLATSGSDRESYVAVVGDPPKPTPEREALQVSLFTTTGELKSPFAFVEAADMAPETNISVKWTAPEAKDITAPTPVTFTFVVRDGRGGIDWTTRAACVGRI